MLSILKNVLLSINLIVALLLILIVLMQRPKNEGLGAAFGGGMTENLFGAQTTNVLAAVTRWLGGIFFAVSLILTYIYAHETGQQSSIAQRLRNAAVPVAPATPAPATPAAEAPAISPAPGPTPAVPATPPAASAPVEVPAPAATTASKPVNPGATPSPHDGNPSAPVKPGSQ